MILSFNFFSQTKSKEPCSPPHVMHQVFFLLKVVVSVFNRLSAEVYLTAEQSLRFRVTVNDQQKAFPFNVESTSLLFALPFCGTYLNVRQRKWSKT